MCLVTKSASLNRDSFFRHSTRPGHRCTMRLSPRSTENPLPQGCRSNPDGLNQKPQWGSPHASPKRKWSLTDIATGWTETRSAKNKAQKWGFQAIKDVTASYPSPIRGIDSDNGSEFTNWELFRWC